MYVQQSRVPMSLLREDESLDLLSKQRLTKFLQQIAIAVQKSGAIALSKPPEVSEEEDDLEAELDAVLATDEDDSIAPSALKP